MKVLFSFSHQTLLLSNSTFKNLKFYRIHGRCKKFFAHYISSTKPFLVSEEFKLDKDHKAIVIKNPNHYSINVTIIHRHHDKQHTITLKPKQSVLFVHDDHVTHTEIQSRLVKEIRAHGFDVKVVELRLSDYDIQYRYFITKRNRTIMLKEKSDLSRLSPRILPTIKRLLLKYPLP